MKTVWFDMDGTIADLYGVQNWLTMLRAQDPTPYAQAAPKLNMSKLAKLLHQVQAAGWRIGIISWLSKEPDPTYDLAVTRAKKRWLNTHLTSVSWDEINIVAYGTPKYYFSNNNEDILFDDEEKNRNEWTGHAYAEYEIISVLKTILSED